MHRWQVLVLVALGMIVLAQAQSPAVFTRPGTVVLGDLVGQVSVVKDGAENSAKAGELLRAEVTLKVGRRSSAAVELSNGSTLLLGLDSEVVVEEFWQLPHSQAGKAVDWKEEPSASRATLRLMRGDLGGKIKRLKVARGSSFTLELVAGSLRVTEGAFHARVQMTPLGLGLCVVELESGEGEFEPAGGKPLPLTRGKRLAFSVEQDARTGSVKVEPAPEPEMKR